MAREITNQLRTLVDLGLGSRQTQDLFLKALENGKITRDEGALEHFCVFFMAVDYGKQMVYLGHHRKSNHWLPNGGHLDQGESLTGALEREIWEEWGLKISPAELGHPVLITTIQIENPKQWSTCKTHYDVWYFVNVNNVKFIPDSAHTLNEFYEMRWVSLTEALQLIDGNHEIGEALSLISHQLVRKTN